MILEGTAEDSCDVKGSDRWLRHILENHAISNEKPRKLKPNYLENKFAKPDVNNNERRISGRLLSLAKNIEEFATKIAEEKSISGIKFRGVIHAGICDLRNFGGIDVRRDPLPGDGAHANLVLINPPLAQSLDDGAPSKISHPFLLQLIELFEFVDQGSVSELDSLRNC